MLFKLKSWEIHLQKIVPLLERPTCFFILAEDPFLSFLAKNLIVTHLGGPSEFSFRLGNEVNVDWVEQELLTPSLFAQKHEWILNGQEIKKEVATLIGEHLEENFQRYIFFTLSQSSATLWKEISKKKSWPGPLVIIESPQFWEWPRFLTSLLAKFSLQITPSAQKMLLEMVKNSPYDLYQALNQLSLHYPSGQQQQELTEQNLREVLTDSAWDFFSLAQTFCGRQFKNFFLQLTKKEELGSEQTRQLAIFMQNCLLKMQDSHSLQKIGETSKLSRHDEELIKYSRLWSLAEIVRARKMWSNIETSCKSSGDFLRHQFRVYARNE